MREEEAQLAVLNRFRHVKRYRQIINVLARYGFSEVIGHLKHSSFLSGKTSVKETGSSENISLRGSERLRLALEELGPAFIKIGQLLSTRADLLPKEYVDELSKLQDSVAPIPAEDVVSTIEQELNVEMGDVFASFDETPLAVASIGQVHRALLSTGEELAVKVKKPDIEPRIIQDLDILQRIAVFLEKKTAWGKLHKISELAVELRKNILEELDYKNEGRNADRFSRNFNDSPGILIPHVYWKYTTRNVLALEYRKGDNLNTILDNGGENAVDRSRLAEAIVDAYFKQIFEHGFFHGDPHPGNIIVLPEEQIMFVDFGTAGYINEDLRGKFQNILKSIISERNDDVADGIIDLGFAPVNVDRRELSSDIGRIQGKYYHVPLDNILLSEVLTEFIDISFKHNIHMPREFLLLVKTLGTLESIVSRLDPGYRLINSLNRFGDTIQGDFMNWNKKQLKDLFFSYEKLLSRFPVNVNRISENIAEGELKVKIEMVNTDPPLKRLGSMVNRLSFSIVLASIIISISMFAGNSTDIIDWGNLPLTEAALIGAGLLGVWWVVSVFKRTGKY